MVLHLVGYSSFITRSRLLQGSIDIKQFLASQNLILDMIFCRSSDRKKTKSYHKKLKKPKATVNLSVFAPITDYAQVTH